MRTRVTTANVNSEIQGDARRAAYAAAATGSDILCTQEDHTTPNSGALMPDGWATFQGATRRCSVHWRADLFELVESRSLLLNEANGLTFPAASRTAAVAVLRDKRNGETVKVTSVHLVPHADDDNQPGVLTTMPRGPKAVIPAIETLTRDSLEHPAVVELIVGDVNVDLDSDLRISDNGMAERFRAAGFVTDVEALGATPDTHGTQEYDWLLTKGGVWVGHETRAKGQSDHNAKTATVEY